MWAFSWIIGLDTVLALSLACYHSSIQKNIATRFDDFFLAKSYIFTFSNISRLRDYAKSRDFTYKLWTVSKHLLSLLL